MKNCNYFEKTIQVLKDLKEKYNLDMAKHISLATSDYGDIFTMSDKELFKALEKHKSELDILNNIPENDIDLIILETEELFKEVDSEDEDLEEE